MEGETSAVLPVKFSNFFSVKLREWLGGFYRHAQRAKQAVTDSLGVGQVKCPDVGAAGGLGFAPEGNLYSE